MLAAVTQRGCALEYASEALRDDEEVVLAACRQNGMAMQFASIELRDDQSFVEQALVSQVKYIRATFTLTEFQFDQPSPVCSSRYRG